jgi:hypothetical protein
VGGGRHDPAKTVSGLWAMWLVAFFCVDAEQANGLFAEP